MRRGLFFGVTVAFLIAIIFLSMGLWTASLKTREGKGPEEFKIRALMGVESSVSGHMLSESAGPMLKRSLYYLDWHTRHSGVYSRDVAADLREIFVNGRCGPLDLDWNGEQDMSSEEFELLASECAGSSRKNWTAKCRGFDLNSDGFVDEKDGRCLAGEGLSTDSFRYFEKTVADAAGEQGFDVSLGVGRFEVKQGGPWTVNVTFEVRVNVSDNEGTIGIERTSVVSSIVPIEGLEDPLVGVESWNGNRKHAVRPGVERSIIRFEGGAFVEKVAEGIEGARGKGWAYGEIAEQGGPADKEHILLVRGSAESILGVAGRYSGVILEGTPEVSSVLMRDINSSPSCMVICEYNIYEEISNCLDCITWTPETCEEGSRVIGVTPCPSIGPPYLLELTGKNIVKVPFASGVSPGNSTAILMDSHGEELTESFDRARNASRVELWDVEGLRELVLCGGYVESRNAPDFLQRLRGESYSKSENGIESFVPFESNGKEPVSGADYLYYRGVRGIAIKGMPGCTNRAECASNWPNGVFALDSMHAGFYGADGIICGNHTAPC